MTVRLHAVALVLAAMYPAASMANEPEESSVLTPSEIPAALSATSVDWTGFSVGLELGYAPDVDGASGAIYGAKLAWDYDFGDYIAGVFLQHTRSGLEIDPGFEIYYSRLGARGGIESGLNMFYASVGYGVIDTHARGNINPGKGNGYFVGLGYERFIRESVTIGAEVVHSEFSDFSRDYGDLDVTTLALLLNYRF
ncbi:MAG: outer membrane protein [Ruegeria sp.]